MIDELEAAREARQAYEIKAECKRAVVNWSILALRRQWR